MRLFRDALPSRSTPPGADLLVVSGVGRNGLACFCAFPNSAAKWRRGALRKQASRPPTIFPAEFPSCISAAASTDAAYQDNKGWRPPLVVATLDEALSMLGVSAQDQSINMEVADDAG